MFSQHSRSGIVLQESRFTEDERHVQLQQYLEEKINEISQLHKCFHHVAEELKEQQGRNASAKASALSVQQQCASVREELRQLFEDFAALRNIQLYYQQQIQELPYIISQALLDNRRLLGEKFLQQTDNLRRKYQFDLFRIEEQQKTETEILKAQHNRQLEEKSQRLAAAMSELERYRSLDQSKLYQPNGGSVWLKERSNQYQTTGCRSKRGNLSASRDQSLAISQQLQCSPIKRPTRNKHAIPRTPSIRKKVIERAMGTENIAHENLQSALKESIELYQHSTKNKVVSRTRQIHTLPSLQIQVPSRKCPQNGYNSLVVDNRQVYRGMWLNGKFHGRGKLIQEQWTYDGEFQCGLPEGLGSLYLPKKTYTGRFSQGQAHGEGTITFDGQKLSGIWQHSRLIQLL